MKSAFEKIAAGLDDAIAHAKGEPGRARVAAPIDVKALVAATGKTQQQFAASYRIPIGTVRDWSQNRRKPDAPARVLLSMIAVDHEAVERLVAATAEA
ncbi:helix-turn-helix domain-containing protein [Sphingomonas sp. MMS24-J13]|uniref:helix-turn-helix domain-containing protein n=1 Tax=Sphingomonas sp. MMS24-J13 TaxID=3238686 RepID=UPI00384A5AA0